MDYREEKGFYKRGQVTVFIIIALVIIGAVIFYFVARDSFSRAEVPAALEPAYSAFLTCVEEQTLLGIGILEQQGGYIELPEFIPGSSYMPFSSQLDFSGVPVPYWYYVDYAGIPREQVPSKTEMEENLGDFIDRQIQYCNFDLLYEDEFNILFDEPNTDVDISGDKVVVGVDMDLSISKADESVIVKNHKIEVSSEIGNLYDEARDIYDLEQETLFLETYGVDNVRLFAPVDGVEIQCSPEIWSADQVFSDLESAIEINTLALGTPGNVVDDYFAIDYDSGYNVRFMNSRNWAHAFEVNPSEGNLLVAEPVGNTPGLGILGFCYVPYHYVYNAYYPVVVQVYSEEEIFQFPMAVVIEGNKEREALSSISIGRETEVCKYPDTEIYLRTYDVNLNPIVADISYDCLGEKCGIGKTENGTLLFPQCVNGNVVAKAEGYVDTSVLLSTVNSGSIEIIMQKLYTLGVDLKMDGLDYNSEAIISFSSPELTKTIFYPEQSTIQLAEGNYDVQVQIFKESSLTLGAATQEQCVEVPRSGLGGLIGLTEKECFEVEIPEQVITNVLAGGGTSEVYILEPTLASSSSVVISTQSLPEPSSLEKLQDNYDLFEERGVSVSFR